jgi:hypothetical protein
VQKIKSACIHNSMVKHAKSWVEDMEGTIAMQVSLRCKRASKPRGPLDVDPTIDTSSKRFL